MNYFKKGIYKTIYEVTSVISTEFMFSDTGNTNPATACSLISDNLPLYSADSVLSIGSILYTDALLTTPFDGLGWSWHTGGLPGLTYVISSTGVIVGSSPC